MTLHSEIGLYLLCRKNKPQFTIILTQLLGGTKIHFTDRFNRTLAFYLSGQDFWWNIIVIAFDTPRGMKILSCLRM